jgi:hypothetical protein
MKSRWLVPVPVAAIVLWALLAAAQPRPASSPAPSPAHSDDEYLAHVARISKDLPTFTVVVRKPFVIAGDDTPAAVRATGVQTVKWAVDHLKKDFFDKDPVDLIDIYLFKDKPSYDKYTKEYFHDPAISPYGYYSPTHKALIMNISTGGGTLVHEIVHPFMAANFPACPTWFNEGLASLYEQSMDKDGHIWGLPNWRLIDLKQQLSGAAPAGVRPPPSFKTMCAMDSATFYDASKGSNYGVARYLCLYLQDQGVLRQFYKDFVKNQKDDPTGYETLKKTLAGLGEKDMDAFRKKWEKWVLALKFP